MVKTVLECTFKKHWTGLTNQPPTIFNENKTSDRTYSQCIHSLDVDRRTTTTGPSTSPNPNPVLAVFRNQHRLGLDHERRNQSGNRISVWIDRQRTKDECSAVLGCLVVRLHWIMDFPTEIES